MSIVQAWRDDCNKKHGCVRPDAQKFVPKRLLHVSKDADSLRLVETVSMPQKAEYLALSHPWGEETKVNPHFRTTTGNYKDHLGCVPEFSLPKTFLDAIKVTRALGVEYIWIDSICIVQEGRDGDFDEQAPYMQDIYSSASAVIAATSAVNMASGFLEQEPHRVASVLSSGVGTDEKRRLYVSSLVDDFHNDVLGAHLNSRGWVFQERALGRRTIHFARNQTYWECGKCFRCETLGSLAK
jgi:hypothetical protein